MAAPVNDLYQRLKDAISRKAEVVPPGWLTSNQWAAKWKLSGTQARCLLGSGLELGLVERRKFRVQNGRRVCLVPHYREIPKKPRR